jgi:hypothetical protein
MRTIIGLSVKNEIELRNDHFYIITKNDIIIVRNVS